MKLGESGEAFFIEEVEDDSLEEETLAATPSIIGDETKNDFVADEEMPMFRPRRNSIDLPEESADGSKKFENQTSDFRRRR